MGLGDVHTVKDFAKAFGISERTAYRHRQYIRYRAFDWAPVFGGKYGKYGKCGIALVADICYHCDKDEQLFYFNLIKKRGATAAHEAWRRECDIRRSVYRNPDQKKFYERWRFLHRH